MAHQYFAQHNLTGSKSTKNTILGRLLASIYNNPGKCAMWHTRQLGRNTSYYSHYFALMANFGFTMRVRAGSRVNLTLTEAGVRQLRCFLCQI